MNLNPQEENSANLESPGSAILNAIACFLMPLATFGYGITSLSEEATLSPLLAGSVFSVCFMALLFAWSMGMPVHRSIRRLTLPAIFFLLTYVTSYTLSFTAHSNALVELSPPVFRIMLALIVAAFACSLDWTKRSIKASLIVSGLIVILIDTFILLRGSGSGGFIAARLHENHLAAFCFAGIFFSVFVWRTENWNLLKLSSGFLFVVAIAAMVVSRGRSLMIASLLGIIASFLLPWITLFFGGRWLPFVALGGLCVAAPFVYDAMYETDLASAIDDYSVPLTGKSMYTGREKLWRLVIDDISTSPFFGLGINSADRWEWDLRGGGALKLSAHNYYLAVLHEAGILGLFGVAVLLTAVWSILSQLEYDTIGRISAGFFIAILFNQSFEVCLTSGDYLRSMQLWSIIGVGLSRWGIPRQIAS